MRKIAFVVCVAALTATAKAQQTSIRLDHVDGVVDDKMRVEQPVTFHLRLINSSTDTYFGSINAFHVYSPDGAVWVPGVSVKATECKFPPCPPDTTWYGQFIDPVGRLPLVWKGRDPQIYDGSLHVNVRSHAGQSDDTLEFLGFASSTGLGIQPGFDDIGFTITIKRVLQSSAGLTICLDTAFYPPSGGWLWAGSNQVAPEWDGPHCYTVGVCFGFRGNVDGDPEETITVSDLTWLISYMFKHGPNPVYMTEADIDGNNAIDIADLTYMIRYMFKHGPAPAACP